MVVRVGDDESPLRVDANTVGGVQLRVRGGTVVAAIARDARAGDGRDRAIELDATDAVVERVGDMEPAHRVERDVERIAKRRAGRLARLTAEAERAAAADRGDRSVRSDAANALVRGVRDRDAPRRVDREAGGQRDERRGRRRAIAAKSRRARSRDGRDHVVQLDAPDTKVERIVEHDAPLGIDAYTDGKRELGRRRRDVVPVVARVAVARDRDDRVVELDATDAAVERVRDDDAPHRIDRDAIRRLELGTRRRLRVAAVTGSFGGSGHGHDRVAFDSTNDVIVRVGDVDAAEAVDNDAVGAIEQRQTCRNTGIETGGTGTRDRLDRAVDRDATNPMVACIGDVHVADAIDRDTRGRVELCARRRPAVAGGRTTRSGSRDRRDAAIDLDPADAMVVGVRDVKPSPAVGGEATWIRERDRRRCDRCTHAKRRRPLGHFAHRAAVGDVRVAVVAVFALIEQTIAADLHLAAVLATPVPRREIAVVAGLADVDSHVAAEARLTCAALASTRGPRGRPAAVSVRKSVTCVDVRRRRATTARTDISRRTDRVAARDKWGLKTAGGRQDACSDPPSHPPSVHHRVDRHAHTSQSGARRSTLGTGGRAQRQPGAKDRGLAGSAITAVRADTGPSRRARPCPRSRASTAWWSPVDSDTRAPDRCGCATVDEIAERDR